MSYNPKHLSREEKRRRQKARGIVTGLSILVLSIAAGFALGWWL